MATEAQLHLSTGEVIRFDIEAAALSTLRTALGTADAAKWVEVNDDQRTLSVRIEDVMVLGVMDPPE